jgi:thiol-disulfide isomerase/thioredoxin
MRFLLLLSIFLSHQVFSQPGLIKGILPVEFSGKSVQLTLMNYETRKDVKVQEVTADDKGAFQFIIPLKEPFIYTVSVADSNLLQVLVKPGDSIRLQINYDGIICTGSLETQYLIDYEINRKKVFAKYLKRTYDSSAAAVLSGDKARIEYWNVQHEKASEQYKAELAVWVEQPFFINSLAAVHHSMRWHSDNDIALMDQMVAIYQKKYPNYELTRQLVSRVDATKRIALGASAPEFITKDTAGNNVDLKSYQGKYTLIEFWASWCPPCREESPTLVRLYDRYKNKGFDMLSVSIDTEKTRWTKAIRKDGYVWENVSELDGYSGSTAALYTVTAIPNSFLLDKNGKIIAKNLRGKDLENKLIELLGN